MKKFLTLSLVFCAAVSLSAQQTLQDIYIKEYASLAVEEMYRSGVPASITLAQGLLESGNGKSELAVKGNNHFGIKCHNDWKGGRIYHDDDRKGECFRKYTHPEQSYRDHSDFLRYRDRYSFLFDLEPTDYKGWAYGLKKAGYATDPSYPAKLIRIIEEYRLYEYDTQRPSSKKATSETRKATSEARKEQTVRYERPVSPSVIEQAVALSRELYSRNGVPFVYAMEGETYASIAESHGLFLKEILRFNDTADGKLLPGTVVYLQAKKSKAAKGLDKHIVDGNETLVEIAQRYAVKLKKIYALNHLDETYVPREGDVLKLRK